MVQFVVPLATPDLPPEAVQVTFETPTLSDADPLIRIVAADVETIVVAGELTRSVGADLSAPVSRLSTGCTGAGSVTVTVVVSLAVRAA